MVYVPKTFSFTLKEKLVLCLSDLVVNARFPFSCINSHSSKYLSTRCTLISKLRYDFMCFINGLNWGNSFVSRYSNGILLNV